MFERPLLNIEYTEQFQMRSRSSVYLRRKRVNCRNILRAAHDIRRGVRASLHVQWSLQLRSEWKLKGIDNFL